MSEANSGSWRNEHITTGLWDEMISTLEEPCKSAAEVICYSFYHFTF